LEHACENLGGLGPLVWEEIENGQTVHKPKLKFINTHALADGINGAILQAACVSWALQGLQPDDLRKRAFNYYFNLKLTLTRRMLRYAPRFHRKMSKKIAKKMFLKKF
jgi:hypothetical protein